jgi:hypothetical protein
VCSATSNASGREKGSDKGRKRDLALLHGPILFVANFVNNFVDLGRSFMPKERIGLRGAFVETARNCLRTAISKRLD